MSFCLLNLTFAILPVNKSRQINMQSFFRRIFFTKRSELGFLRLENSLRSHRLRQVFYGLDEVIHIPVKKAKNGLEIITGRSLNCVKF